VELPAKPNYIEINPDQRLMDINRLNNSYFKGFPSPFPKFRLNYNLLDHHNPVPLDAYQLLFNPSFWYNDIDGLKSGVRLKGSYLQWRHQLDLGIWMGPQSGRFHYAASLKEPTFWLGQVTYLELSSFYQEGRQGGEIGIVKDRLEISEGRHYLPPQGSRYGASVSAYRLTDSRWLPPTVRWENGDLNFGKVFYKGIFPGRYYSQEINTYLSTGFFRSDFNFHKIFLEYKGELDFRFSHSWAWRVAFGYANGNLAAQDRFYLASASPLEEFQNPWYRSRGSLPNQWRNTGDLYLPGGGNVRGYTDRNNSGSRLFSFNFKWAIPNYLKQIPIDIPYLSTQLNGIGWDLFYDFGSVWDTLSGSSPFREQPKIRFSHLGRQA
jgi:hypothetical protein